MGPQIRYCATRDGVSLAYYMIGKGPGLVMMPNLPMSHLQLEWESEHAGVEQLSQIARVVRFDSRGFGLSERDVETFSVDALADDLETVTVAAGLDRFVLLATTFAAPASILFAARDPDRVTHLLLVHAVARGADAYVQQMDSLMTLFRTDWELGVDALADISFAWAEREREITSLVKASVTATTLIAFLEQFRECDVSESLSRVAARTLALHRREYRPVSLDVARRLAAAIPGATLAALPGDSDILGEEARAVMLRFVLGRATPDNFNVQGYERSPGATGNDAARATGTAIILFADIVDSTALTERMGDSAFRGRARELDASMRRIITAAGGTTIDGKLLGDGVLATFLAASEAIDAALLCGAAGDELSLPLHLGIHAGDVIREQNNVYGGAVNVASRISGLSGPCEVLVSDIVRGLARTSAAVTFDDRGEHALKGVSDPQRVFSVRRAE